MSLELRDLTEATISLASSSETIIPSPASSKSIEGFLSLCFDLSFLISFHLTEFRLLSDFRFFSSVQLIVSLDLLWERGSNLSSVGVCREGGTAPGGGPRRRPLELTIALFPNRRLFTVSDVGEVETPTKT